MYGVDLLFDYFSYKYVLYWMLTMLLSSETLPTFFATFPPVNPLWFLWTI